MRAMAKNLKVILESHKGKRSENFLGSDFSSGVKLQTYCHDLPSKAGADAEHGFKPKYEINVV
jgi:DNA topoisomerase-1